MVASAIKTSLKLSISIIQSAEEGESFIHIATDGNAGYESISIYVKNYQRFRGNKISLIFLTFLGMFAEDEERFIELWIKRKNM